MGKEFIGFSRPLLFNIYNWRKSVDFALKLEDEENFLSVKYEDLVSNSVDTFGKITDFLGVDSFDATIFSSLIKDQKGEVWKSNSSFRQTSVISSESVGKYKKMLPEEVVKYIEFTCFPEMKRLGYEFDNFDVNESFAKDYKEFFDVEREDFAKNYSSDSSRIDYELIRFNMFKEGFSQVDEIKKYFIFEETYKKLCK